MPEYRALNLPNITKNIQKSYNKLYKTYDQYGIFTGVAQQKLLEFPEIDKSPYGPQFWSKIRKSVQKGLIDLSLFCNLANSEQLEKTLWKHEDMPTPGTIQSSMTPLLPNLLSVIFYQNPKDEVAPWKFVMANRMLSEIFRFYRNSGIVSSKTYERMLDEVEDFLKIEVYRQSVEKK